MDMDLQISASDLVLVSLKSWISGDFCLRPSACHPRTIDFSGFRLRPSACLPAGGLYYYIIILLSLIIFFCQAAGPRPTPHPGGGGPAPA